MSKESFTVDLVTDNKIYTLRYNEGVDFDDVIDIAEEVYRSLPEGSKLISIPNWCKLEEVDKDELEDMRDLLNEALENL